MRIAYHAGMRELWRSIVGDQQAPTSEPHPSDHEPLWEPLGDWRVCKICGHIDGGGKWDRLIINAVMFGVVCLFITWLALLVF
jgi:hypothetical protein